MARRPMRYIDGVLPPKATWRMDPHADFFGVADGHRYSIQLPILHAHQAGRTARLEVDLESVHPLCQALLDIVDEMSGTRARVIIRHDAQHAPNPAEDLEESLPPVLMAVQRLALLALLLHPCPPPNYSAGQDCCTCGSGTPWPCSITEAAWIARGQSPAEEVERVFRTVGEDIAFENIAERLRGEGLGDSGEDTL